jgi:hypothetical protein
MIAEEKNRDEHKEDMSRMEVEDRERERRGDKEPQAEEEQERPVVEEGKEVGEEKEHARTEEEQERPDVEEEVEGSHVPFDTATDEDLHMVILNYVREEKSNQNNKVKHNQINKEKLYKLFCYAASDKDKSNGQSSSTSVVSARSSKSKKATQDPSAGLQLNFFVHCGIVFALEPPSSIVEKKVQDKKDKFWQSRTATDERKDLRVAVLKDLAMDTKDAEKMSIQELAKKALELPHPPVSARALDEHVTLIEEIRSFNFPTLVANFRRCLRVPCDFRGLSCPVGCGKKFPSRIWLDSHLDERAVTGNCPTSYVCRPLHWPIGFIIPYHVALMINRLSRADFKCPLLNPYIRPLHCANGMNPSRGRAGQGDKANSAILTSLYPERSLPKKEGSFYWPSEAFFQYAAMVFDGFDGNKKDPPLLEPPLVNMAFILTFEKWEGTPKQLLLSYSTTAEEDAGLEDDDEASDENDDSLVCPSALYKA